MRHPQREEAVSPVIGTILMVVITVMLAVIVGGYVFGVGDTRSTSKDVAIVASQNPWSCVTFTVHGGPDLQELTALDIIQAGNTTNWKSTTPHAGDSYTITSSTRPLVVVGTFTDGSKQILWLQDVGAFTASPTPVPLDKNVVVNPQPVTLIDMGTRYSLPWTFSGTGTGNIQSLTGYDGNGIQWIDVTMVFVNGVTYGFSVPKAALHGSHINVTFTDASIQTLYTWP